MYSKVNDLLLILPDVKVEEPNSKESGPDGML